MKTKFSLRDKHAVITGAGSGIGQAIAENFASTGAKVVILDVDETAAASTVDKIEHSGGTASYIRCDITYQPAVISAFEEIRTKGPIDILVNNAGVAHVGNAESTDWDAFNTVMQVNVYGMYNCLHAVLPFMKTDGGGVICNVASALSSVAIPNRFAYGTSKGAVLTMTYSVALDYIDDNIRCNCISPGRVHTPFVDGFIAKNYPGREEEMFDKLSKDHPIGRMAKPSEMADLVRFLCSDEASFITGSNHAIDGGFTHLVSGN